LNNIDYQGPLSIEWEDSGMDRFHGAKEAASSPSAPTSAQRTRF
jgi:hypothetical protein